MTEKAEILNDFIPIGILNAWIFFLFGVLGAAQSMTFIQAMAASMLIYSSPLQIIMVQNLDDGVLLIPIILALNARFALMTATLMPYISPNGNLQPKLSSQLIVPSIFSLCLTKFRRGCDDPVAYFRITGVALFIIAILSTGIGYQASLDIPNEVIRPLISFTLALLFVALNARLWPRYSDILVFWTGLFSMPLFLYFFGNLALLIGPFVIGILYVLWEKKRSKRKVE